ncbi:MAG TPA: GDP-mannose 4,6-dehydratase, partial [Methylomirabilota bacterium]|nr:GDP-mannose 4,6-dehydratase [Methylomirabilota bacterium]
MRVLITGITGFVGSHLAEWALAQGADVVGSVRWRSSMEHIDHLRDRLTLVSSDLRDLSSVRTLLEQARADYIVHLAAQSFVGASWETPTETLLTNAVSQTNLFEAIRQLGSRARFLVIGSSEEYGLVYPEELPIRETNPLRPLSPYAVSKVTQDLMGFQYWKSYGLDIVRTRAFNHSVGRYTPV